MVERVKKIDAITLIQPGSLSIEYGEYYDRKIAIARKKLGVAGESSIVLIESQGHAVLIDTGFRNERNISKENLESNKRHVEAAFSAYKYSTSDVEEIFVTHWHHDHVGNAPLFPSAVLRYGAPPNISLQAIMEEYSITNTARQLDPADEWVPGVSVFSTPGHNEHHHSVLVHYEDLTIVIAGDCIVSQSYYDNDAVWKYNGDFYSEKMAIQSMKKIIQTADLIIPGHGHPFQNYKKAWPDGQDGRGP